LSAERIAAVNRAADSLEAGDVLLIPAVYHEELQTRGQRSTRSKSGVKSAALGSKKSAAVHSGHIATSRRLPPQVLHRKAVIRTASLDR
jgi:hypothetical protein